MNIGMLLFSSLLLLISPFDARNTITCSQRYTLAPTSNPTPNPSTYEPPLTHSPSAAVTVTQEPTRGLGDEAEIPICEEGGYSDVIILNDISCSITSSQCKSQQEQIADTIYALKGYPEGNKVPMKRVGYIEFDCNTADIIYSLEDDYNEYVTETDIDSYRDFVAQSGCDNMAERDSSKGGDLIKALDLAMEHFDDAESDNYDGRDRKIVIFSNCPITNTEEVCNEYEDYIREGSNSAKRGDNTEVGFGINVVMVNQGFIDESYLLCLVEYDDQRIKVNRDFNDDIFYNEVLPGIADVICKAPSPAPTTDPTNDPTTEPTINSNGNGYDEETSTRRLIRRLQDDEEDEYQVEFTTNTMHNSPCIYMELSLQTENVLPNNMAPDARTNIQIIGRALGNSTGGTINVPDPIDREDDEPIDYDPTLDWTMDPECEGSPQMEDTYWPMAEDMPIQSESTDAYNVDDGFIIEVGLKTANSIVYRFELDSLNLSISHDCADDLMMAAAIYLKDELVDQTENLTICDGDESVKTFHFSDTVILKANKLYTVMFALVNGYPNGCDINNVKYEGMSLSDIIDYDSNALARRRLNEILNYADIVAVGHPDSCTLSAQLAVSEQMRTGVSAMCQTNTLQTRPQIEAGLFQQHASQSAIANHLFMTGSLHLFDENGTATRDIPDWPEFGVEEPCIAIDEVNRIIYAIGGHDGSGAAVDYIQGYQFDNDELTEGHIIEHLRNFRLPDLRYGSECFYWYKDNDDNPDKIILISGMDDKASELTKRGDFHKDIEMFDIPNPNNPFVTSGNVDYTKNPSALTWNIIDAKPLLIGDDLYFFGGKTHLESKPYVSRMNLNNFVNSDGEQIDAAIELTEGKALPLIDKVTVNCTEAGQPEELKECYMVFAGQGYATNDAGDEGQLIPSDQGGIETNYLQLFCNDGLGSYNDDVIEDRRRLQGVDGRIIPSFTEFDMKMLKKGKEMNRRRLTQGVEIPKSDVFMRNYNYALDGLYYNFSVFIEQCYDDNDELAEAEELYTSIISSKMSNDKHEWMEFKDELEEKILNKSKEAYRGWNNLGFGVVDIWDFKILNISYEATPSPKTGCDGDYKHTERRKHRYYYKNYEDDEDEDNFIWIDDQFDKGYADEEYDGNDNLF